VPLLDVLDPSAVEVSAVNTIVNEGGRLVGTIRTSGIRA
jgi:shikimate 5-dehydrogenase